MKVLKENCWQIKKCGREPNGARVKEMGACSAATDQLPDGINGGRWGGRICWSVAGTLCGGKVQGSFAAKQTTCLSCDVYKRIRTEEGATFKLTPPGPAKAAAS